MPPSADAPLPVPPSVAPVQDPSVASLYQEIILSHYRAPKHKGVLTAPSVTVEQRNPLCGDVLTVQLERVGDRVINAGFTARACSITQATASMLLERVIGQDVVGVTALLGHVERLIEGTATESEMDGLGDLRSLASVTRFPARKACVRLVTGALGEALTTSTHDR